jgi:hypothetical protein
MILLLVSHWPACNSLCPACFHNPTHCFCSIRLGSLLYGLVRDLLVLPEELLVLLGVPPDLVLPLLWRLLWLLLQLVAPLLRRLGLLLLVEVDILTSALFLVSGLSDGGLYPETDRVYYCSFAQRKRVILLLFGAALRHLARVWKGGGYLDESR